VFFFLVKGSFYDESSDERVKAGVQKSGRLAK